MQPPVPTPRPSDLGSARPPSPPPAAEAEAAGARGNQRQEAANDRQMLEAEGQLLAKGGGVQAEWPVGDQSRGDREQQKERRPEPRPDTEDRKSTRLNSSH